MDANGRAGMQLAARAETELGQSDDVERLATRRSATHWLFARIVGVSGLSIPDTALFDDEGVLTAWLSSTVVKPNKTTKKQRQNVVIRSRDVLEQSLLRLEAYFQDQAQGPKRNTAVAVLYSDPELRVLDEEALDEVIRDLCARERRLTATEPDMGVSRAYPGGRFVLQAAVASSPLITTKFHADHGASEGFTHDVHAGTRDDDDGNERRQCANWSTAFADAETQCRAVLRHLRAAHGLIVRRLTLEFVYVGASQISLTSARLVELTRSSEPSPVMGGQSRHNVPNEKSSKRAPDADHRSKSYRVCRQCRTPVDVDLAREVLRRQTIARDVLAKYQLMSERHADAETRCRAACDRVALGETRIMLLEAEIAKLREDLVAQISASRNLIEEKQVIAEQLVQVEALVNSTEKQVEDANLQIQKLQQQQALEVQSSEADAASRQRAWEEQDALRREELSEVRETVDRLVTECADLQTQLEETRAAADELRFQWAYVVRKLTDVNDAGVLPPKRIAGGYSSYPTPTPPNVEHVVKWIVDYAVRRTVLDAQQHRSTIPAKRRLQLHVELMRVLARGPLSLSPVQRARSSSRRRRSSRSPEKQSKRASTSPTPRKSVGPSTSE